jgi:hypothetical protein
MAKTRNKLRASKSTGMRYTYSPQYHTDETYTNTGHTIRPHHDLPPTLPIPRHHSQHKMTCHAKYPADNNQDRLHPCILPPTSHVQKPYFSRYPQMTSLPRRFRHRFLPVSAANCVLLFSLEPLTSPRLRRSIRQIQWDVCVAA